jgi:hypothetical protein
MDQFRVLGDDDPTKTRVWREAFRAQLIGKLVAADMNSTADQQIPSFIGGRDYRITGITAANASIPLDVAAGGVYTQPGKGGTAVVAPSQAYSALTAANLALDLTIDATAGVTILPGGTGLYLSLSSPQGSPASVDFLVYGQVF